MTRAAPAPDPAGMTSTPLATTPADPGGLALMLRQLSAIDRWHSARRAGEAAEAAAVTREMRLDLARRMDARRREQQALVGRAAEHLAASGSVLSGTERPRALVAHRNDWLRNKLADRLSALGIRVVGMFGDGAEAAGTLVAEQPDIVVLEDRLPTVPGLEVVRRAHVFAPSAVVGVQVLDGAGIEPMHSAGALAVFTRRVPPAEIADSMLRCLQDRTPITLR